MGEFLLIHYKPGDNPGDDNNLLYWAMGGGQHPSITLGHGSLEELTPLSRDKKVYLLLDASFVSIDSLNIPSNNRSKQLQAIPFAMEDDLAEDIDDTHFAIGKNDSDNRLPVIAINCQRLQDILELFAKYGITPEVVSADSLALPGTPEKWCILLDKERVLIKTGHTQAHCCDQENLPTILNAIVEQADNPPSLTSLYHKADDELPEDLLAQCNLETHPKTFQNHPLEVFVQHLNNTHELNLLQGEFAPKRESSLGWLLPWKAAAILAFVWISLHLTYASIISHQLSADNLELSRQIEREFKRAVPEARKMTNMQKRVERKLKDLKSTSGSHSETGFLKLLDKTASILVGQKSIDIKAAVYRNNYIDIDLSSKSLQEIEQLKTKLDKVPGITSVLSTTVEKQSVKGRLRLEAKG